MIIPGMPIINSLGKPPKPIVSYYNVAPPYNQPGVAVLPTIENMSDNVYQPFSAADVAFGQNSFIEMVFDKSYFVEEVIIAASTDGVKGWGASFLNGRYLQFSNGGGYWLNVRTLSGYVTATNSTTGFPKTEPIGTICDRLRITILENHISCATFYVP